MDSIVNNLKAICRQKGLSLTDVANRMGASPSNLLSSVKGNPTISKIQDIADALGVSPAELLTQRPEKALGIVLIDGQTYQLSKPATSTLQIPTYDRYDVLRGELRRFIDKSIEAAETASKMGILDTMEVFCLSYDSANETFTLSLCYADGKTSTLIYDKMEFCSWKGEGEDAEAVWDLDYLIGEITNDIEGYVPTHIHQEEKPAKSSRKGL